MSLNGVYMNKFVKYGILGIIVVMILFISINVIFTNEVTEPNHLIQKITNNFENESNISKISRGTVYKYGNSEISYIKSKSKVEIILEEINNNPNFKKININGTPKYSNTYKTIDGEYAILIIENNHSEAVFIKSKNQKELINAANQIKTGEKVVEKLYNNFNQLNINKV